MSNFISLSLALCLLISVVISGCTPEPAKQEPAKQEPQNDSKTASSKYGGTMKIIMSDTLTNLGYPAELRSNVTFYYNQPVLESLGRYDKEGNVLPFLAESWQSDPQNKTITIKIKPGIKFHDDTDLNAEAVKWNIEQYLTAKRPEVNGIQSVDVIDASTVRLNLAAWDSGLLEAVAYYVKMISPAAVAKNGKDWAILNPVGTGPFKFVSWEKDVSAKFKKNETYWQKGKPYLDAIEYTFIREINTAANVFKTGGADVLTQMDPDMFLELQKSGKYTTWTDDKAFGTVGIGLMFDTINPNSPFANVKVRQAVIHAIDNEAIVKSVRRGLGFSTNQWYKPGLWAHNPDVKGFPYDPDKAKQLLAEAGFPNGFKTKITTDPARENLMTAVQSYLAKVGIDAQVVTVDSAKWTALTNDKWDGMIMFFRAMAPSTLTTLNRVISKNATLYGKNILHPDKVEQLLADSRNAPDFESSKKPLVELQKVLFEEYALAVPLIGLTTGVATQQKIQDLGNLTTNGNDWTPEEAWIKK
ncbi:MULTISPECIES: ABC transporter substrate-binding protein [Paenibacillus]|nr:MULTISPECIES: ABC transporter substrate-binding protein [Paenibacillus]